MAFAPLGQIVIDAVGRFTPAWSSWLQTVLVSRSAVTVTTVTLANGSTIQDGAGTPEGVVYAPIGSLFLRTDSDTDTLYSKTTAATLNTGWVSK